MEIQISLVLLVILGFSSDLFQVVLSVTTCKQDGNCRCTLDDGSKRFFDLSEISRSSEPYFQIGEEGSTYYYDPCVPFSVETSACEGVAGCLKQEIDKVDNFTSLAVHSRVVFNYNDVGENLILDYDNGQPEPAFRTLSVILSCSAGVEHALEVTQADSPRYEFLLISPYSCPQTKKQDKGGLSGGSILCIIFCVAVFVYLVGGFVISIVVQKKSPGVEAIPNYDLWVDLPSLIKEGAMFSTSCLTNRSSYTETVPENQDGADAFGGGGDAGNKGDTKYDAI